MRLFFLPPSPSGLPHYCPSCSVSVQFKSVSLGASGGGEAGAAARGSLRLEQGRWGRGGRGAEVQARLPSQAVCLGSRAASRGCA